MILREIICKKYVFFCYIDTEFGFVREFRERIYLFSTVQQIVNQAKKIVMKIGILWFD